MFARHPHARLALWVLLTLLAISSVGYSQILYGSITGNVKDPSGAPVPGATVQAQNPDTGFQREATTNNDGIYLISDLPPGTYNITITSQAFAKAVLNGAAVTANQVRRADASLQLAQVNQVVRDLSCAARAPDRPGRYKR